MYHKNIELLLVFNVNFWIWSKEWILNDQNRRYILITVDYLLLVSRTDTVCWTERWVKVPKCALIRKLRNCLSQPFRTPTSFYMSLVNPRQNGCCVRSYFWFLRQSISDSFLSWPFYWWSVLCNGHKQPSYILPMTIFTLPRPSEISEKN